MSAVIQAMPAESPFRRIVSAFFESRIATAAFAILALLCLIALFAPWISPQNPFDLSQLDDIETTQELLVKTGLLTN